MISPAGSHIRTLVRRVNPFDVFVAVNTVALMATLAHSYIAEEAEFALYAGATLAAIFVFWRSLRQNTYPMWLLLLLEVAMLAHFSGGLVSVGGERLYAYSVGGIITFDKVVHFANSVAAALFLMHLARSRHMRFGGWEGFIIVMTVAGIGTVIEILEYAAVVTLPQTGVGDYANNLQDLIANALGGITGWGGYRALSSVRRVSAPFGALCEEAPSLQD